MAELEFKMPEFVDDIRRVGVKHEERADMYGRIVLGGMTLGLAGLVSLGVGIAKDNVDALFLGAGVSAFAAVAPARNRRNHHDAIAASYRAQLDRTTEALTYAYATFAPQAETTQQVVRAVIESEVVQRALRGRPSEQPGLDLGQAGPLPQGTGAPETI